MERKKYKVFISSVQKEFAEERSALAEFLSKDVLLRSFFQPFLFEGISASSNTPEQVFIDEVKKSDIYIGLLGKTYGYEDINGISPTEKEYDAAKEKGLPRWIYILKTSQKKHEKETIFIKKVSNDVSWKFFSDTENLIREVYHSCVVFLKQKGKIENNEFDNALHEYATLNDIDNTLLREFIGLAREKRNFPEKANASKQDVLKRLNLFRNGKLVNSALLVFCRNPQQFFPSATVKCAHFHGDIIQKPIPDYKEFTGTVFEMADLAIDFVLSKISVATGTRDKNILVETQYEIPRTAISEAIINALAHRDYYSKAGVQISVFRNRIEIENPGKLPNEITIEDLKRPHASYPHNPQLANCLFLTGAIERYGTGIMDMIRDIISSGLPAPEFSSQQTFKTTLWRRPIFPEAVLLKKQATEQVGEQVREQVILLINALHGKASASQLMDLLSLKARRNFFENYLQPSIIHGYVEMTKPKNPTSSTQTYRLTEAGLKLKEAIIIPAKKADQQITEQPTEQPTEQVKRLLTALENEFSRQEIMEGLNLKHRPTFVYNYLLPALEKGWIEMTIPDKPNDPNQKYRPTVKGKKLQKLLEMNSE